MIVNDISLTDFYQIKQVALPDAEPSDPNATETGTEDSNNGTNDMQESKDENDNHATSDNVPVDPESENTLKLIYTVSQNSAFLVVSVY